MRTPDEIRIQLEGLSALAKRWLLMAAKNSHAQCSAGEAGGAVVDALQVVKEVVGYADRLERGFTGKRLHPPEKIRAAVEFARSAFRNDGAEGETVWLLCEAVEQLTAERVGRG